MNTVLKKNITIDGRRSSHKMFNKNNVKETNRHFLNAPNDVITKMMINCTIKYNIPLMLSIPDAMITWMLFISSISEFITVIVWMIVLYWSIKLVFRSERKLYIWFVMFWIFCSEDFKVWVNISFDDRVSAMKLLIFSCFNRISCVDW